MEPGAARLLLRDSQADGTQQSNVVHSVHKNIPQPTRTSFRQVHSRLNIPNRKTMECEAATTGIASLKHFINVI